MLTKIRTARMNTVTPDDDDDQGNDDDDINQIIIIIIIIKPCLGGNYVDLDDDDYQADDNHDLNPGDRDCAFYPRTRSNWDCRPYRA